MKINLSKLLTFGLFFLPLQLLAADSLSNYTIKVLEPLDARAVIKLPNGDMTVYKVGDKLPNTTAVILEILENKIIIEEAVTDLSGNKEIQKVLLFAEKNGQTRIERFYNNNADERKLLNQSFKSTSSTVKYKTNNKSTELKKE